MGTSEKPGGAKIWIAALLAIAASIDGATAAIKSQIKSQVVEYRHEDTILEGEYIWDDARTAKRLAEMGYVAFVADICGNGVRPPPPKEAGAESRKCITNRLLLRARANAALDMLRQHPLVLRETLGK